MDNNKHLIMIVIDGGRPDIIYDALDKGELPNLNSIFKNGMRVERATSNFPSVTVQCMCSIFTGCEFKKNGILGNVWFDTSKTPVEARAYLVFPKVVESWGRKISGLPTIFLPDIKEGGLINRDLQTPTIYDEAKKHNLTSYAVFSYVGKGATRWVKPRRIDMLRYIGIDKWGWRYEPFDKWLIDTTLHNIKRKLPNIVSITFGGNDGNTHRNGTKDQRRYIRELIDPQIGRLIKGLSKHSKIEDINFVITADHGQTDTSASGNDKILWFDHTIKVLQSGMHGAKVDGGESNEVDDNADILFAVGTGASNSVYVKNQKTKKWKDSPRFVEDLVPIANALFKSSDKRFSSENWYIGEYLSFILIRESKEKPYKIYTSKYPYDGVGELIELEKFFADKLKRYPDAVPRIRGIEHPYRGADIIFVIEYDNKGYYYASGQHSGNHGHLGTDDTYIPLMFAGPKVKYGTISHARIIDIAPTCAAMLDFEMPSADGKVLNILK